MPDLVLRASATAHAGLCTSMLAAVALEISGTGLSKACAISLLRFSNSGPQSLVLTLFSGSRKLRIILLTILLTVTTTLLQLTSTILLFDIGAGLVRGNAQYRSLAIGFKSFAEQASYGSNYWVTMPSNYYMFAEYRRPAPDYDDRWDTGVSKRAFISLPSSVERSSVGGISGDLPVLDTQVICIRPSMVDAKLLRDQRRDVSVDNSNSFFLDGYSITSMGSGSAISNWTFRKKSTFNCSFPTQNPNNDDPKDLPVGFCQVGLGNDSGGRGFLLFKPTGTEESWIKYHNVTRSPVFQGNGRWLDLVVPSGVDVGMSLALCYTNLALDILDTKAHSDEVLPEAQLTWNATQSRYDTREVRKQLETLNYPVGKSHVLVLEKPPAGSKSKVSSNYNWLTKSLSIKDKGTATFCVSCNYSFVAAFKTNRAHTAVFQDILEESDNPALALQSQFTTLFQMGYYDRRVEYDALSSVVLTPFVTVLLPQRYQGFLVVVAITSVHSILVVVIVACFARNVRFSILEIKRVSSGCTNVWWRC